MWRVRSMMFWCGPLLEKLMRLVKSLNGIRPKQYALRWGSFGNTLGFQATPSASTVISRATPWILEGRTLPPASAPTRGVKRSNSSVVVTLSGKKPRVPLKTSSASSSGSALTVVPLDLKHDKELDYGIISNKQCEFWTTCSTCVLFGHIESFPLHINQLKIASDKWIIRTLEPDGIKKQKAYLTISLTSTWGKQFASCQRSWMRCGHLGSKLKMENSTSSTASIVFWHLWNCKKPSWIQGARKDYKHGKLKSFGRMTPTYLWWFQSFSTW